MITTLRASEAQGNAYRTMAGDPSQLASSENLIPRSYVKSIFGPCHHNDQKQNMRVGLKEKSGGRGCCHAG